MSTLVKSSDKQPRKLSKRALKKQEREEAEAKFQREISRDGLNEYLHGLEREVLALDFVFKDPEDRLARENTAAMFNRLIDFANQIDATQGKEGSQRILHWHVYEHLAEQMNDLRAAVLGSSFKDAALPHLSGAIRAIYVDLARIKSEGAVAGLEQNGLAVAELESDTGVKTQFPAIAHESPAIMAAVERLRDTWVRANTRQLSVSDRFMVDALATSYLPDSLRLLANLSRYSEESRVESEKIFLEQVALMQQQLDEIFKQEERAEMSEMRAHTLFLKNKNTASL